MISQAEKARRLLDLHRGTVALVLPNAWDAASARMVEHAGFPAVATSSAAVANSLGYPDGQRIRGEEMLDVVRRDAAAVSVPVTADMEAGYADTDAGLEATIRELIAAGAAGLNFEDSDERQLVDPALQAARIRVIRRVADETGVPLVINARIDTWLVDLDDAVRYRETVRRASIYRDAGADCVYPILLRDAGVIGRLVTELRAPVNILGGPGAPPIPELQQLGVARVSYGSQPMRAALHAFHCVLEELKSRGSSPTLESQYAEIKRLMEQRGAE